MTGSTSTRHARSCARTAEWRRARPSSAPYEIGCRDAFKLGQTTYRQNEEIADPTIVSPQYRVYRSLQQPGRIGTLRPREKAAALLVFQEGYSHAEAAAMLQVPLGTLKSIVARARAALIPLLEGVEA